MVTTAADAVEAVIRDGVEVAQRTYNGPAG